MEEIARAYCEAGMLQEVGDTWALARNADRLAPSAVRTLIQRRAAHLPTDEGGARRDRVARAALQPQGLPREIRLKIGEGADDDAVALGNRMAPAVTAGLLLEQPEAAPADYSFPHEQVREFAADTLAPAGERSTPRSSTSCSPASRRRRRCCSSRITRGPPATRRSA